MSTPEFASAVFTVGQLNALVKIVGPENVPGILDRSLKVVVKKPDLLERVASIPVPSVHRFVAKDCLKKANVGWTGSNFDKLFRDNVEENVPEVTLAASRLKQSSLDAPILTELGDELGDRAEVSLAHVFDLLKRQAYGKPGVLLTNGYANIFYVRDKDKALWAVYAYWESVYRYWNVGAYSIEDSVRRWFNGRLVFSRDS